jgi:hypothetical protein
MEGTNRKHEEARTKSLLLARERERELPPQLY